MEFRFPYLQAMREQAPAMFKDLSQSGEIERFSMMKAREASQMFLDLTKDAPKLPNGYPREPFAREAEERVRAALIQFPGTESEQRDEINALLSDKPITQPTA